MSGWSFASRLDGVAWSSSIAHSTGFYSVHADLNAPASIVAFDVLDEGHASACVQKHNKRPWPFRPTIEMHVLRVGAHAELDHVIVPNIDVTDACWPSKELDSEQQYSNRAELSYYLSFSLGQHSGLNRLGAAQIQTMIRGDPDSGQATILTSFTIEGVKFCQIDNRSMSSVISRAASAI